MSVWKERQFKVSHGGSEYKFSRVGYEVPGGLDGESANLVISHEVEGFELPVLLMRENGSDTFMIGIKTQVIKHNKPIEQQVGSYKMSRDRNIYDVMSDLIENVNKLDKERQHDKYQVEVVNEMEEFDKLFDTQKELDEKIIKENGLEGECLIDKKVLALQVELGEFANELPEVFKFWSKKENDYEEGIVEYCDVLHFILSIGNDLGMNRLYNLVDHENIDGKATVVEQFNEVYLSASRIDENTNAQTYQKLFTDYVKLGEMVGFEWGDVVDAYFVKNDENHKRQDSGEY